MGLFGAASSPFDEAVASATDGQKEDWAKILDVCDRAKMTTLTAKDCLTSIMTRLRHNDQHVVLQAITLLDACVNNCGKTFHLQVASRDFETEFTKILSKSKGTIQSKLMSALRSWAEGDFSKDSQLNLIPSLYNRLRRDYSFPGETSTKVEKPTVVPQQSTEDADLAKAIELSLKEAKESPRSQASKSTSLYMSPEAMSVFQEEQPYRPEGRKVRALYDFEAAEDGELTFKAGEIITIIDEADQNWWKGHNQRGEGLFPSNFVTPDLSVEVEQPKSESKRSVQFNEEVRVKKIVKEEVEIDESKMDKLLHLLHEADPTDPSKDVPEMRDLIDEVNAMGPLIDTELEHVDSKALQLNQLCMDLQGSLNLYHSLMRDTAAPMPAPSYMSKPMGYPYAPQPQPPASMNGSGMVGLGPMYPMGATTLPHPASHAPHHQQQFIPGQAPPPSTHSNGLEHYRTLPGGLPGPQGMYPPTSLPHQSHQQPPPSYQEHPSLM